MVNKDVARHKKIKAVPKNLLVPINQRCDQKWSTREMSGLVALGSNPDLTTGMDPRWECNQPPLPVIRVQFSSSFNVESKLDLSIKNQLICCGAGAQLVEHPSKGPWSVQLL